MNPNLSNQINQINQLIKEQKPIEALKLINEVENIIELNQRQNIELQILKSEILILNKEEKDAISNSTKAIEDSQRLQLIDLEMNARITNLFALFKLGRYDEAIELSKEGEKLVEGLAENEMSKLKKIKAEFYCVIAFIYYAAGELPYALEYGQKSLEISDTLEEKYLYVFNFQVVGPFHVVGLVYRNRGELNLALEYFQKGLKKSKEKNYDLSTAAYIEDIGDIHFRKGNYKLALKYCQKSLALFVKIGNEYRQNSSLAELIWITLAMNDQLQAKKYLNQIGALKVTQDDIIMNTAYRLCKALVLKSSKRIKKLAQSQIILEEIVSEKIVYHRLTSIAIKSLCDILLDELKLSGDEKILKEAKLLVFKLQEMGQTMKLISAYIEGLVLESKISLLEGQIEKAIEILDRAYQVTEQRELHRLKSQISLEQTMLNSEIDKWTEFAKRNAEMYERIQQSKIEEYFKEAKKIARDALVMDK